MTRHRIAIIGLGMAVTPHAKSLVDLEGRVEVAYAFSPSEARRRDFGARFDFPLADTLDRILADKSVGAVLVLTPPNTHLDLVWRSAAAGKHILLEKPLEISTPRALEMIAACRAARVTLGVVLQHRFRPASTKLAEIMRSGALGEIAGRSTTIRVCIELIGTRGTAMLAGTALNVLFHDGKTIEMAPDSAGAPGAGGTGADPMAFPHDYHRAVLADFLDAIEQGREPKVSGREALRVHRLIDALLEAGASGRPVKVGRAQ